MESSKYLPEADDDLSYIAEDLRPLARHVDLAHPDPSNARVGHNIDSIADSLSIYNQNTPIVVNASEGYRILKGNGTYAAAKKLGWQYIAMVIVQKDPTSATGYAIADNKTSDDSHFDDEVLLALLESMPEEVHTGFSEEEIVELVENAQEASNAGNMGESQDAESQIDQAEKLMKEWGVTDGQLWVFPSNKEGNEHLLYVGDCTDPVQMLELMRDEVADLSPSDPPYNVGFDYDSDDVDDEKEKDAYTEFTLLWMSICQRFSTKQIVTPGCINLSMWLRLFDVYHVAPWTKLNSMTNGKVSSFWCWEPVLFFGEKWGKTRHSDIFDYSVGTQKGVAHHPCPKPLKMWEDLIVNYSEENDIVLDMFGGSGTTLIACENHVRQARLMEISPAYSAVIIQRYWDAFGIKPYILDKEAV